MTQENSHTTSIALTPHSGKLFELAPAGRPVAFRYTLVRAVKKPTRAHPGDAGIDFFIPDDFADTSLSHGQSALIPSGVRVDVPLGWALVFMNKSGVATKLGLQVGACVVDHGYTGEVHLHVTNTYDRTACITPGMKLVQGVLLPVGMMPILEVQEDGLYQDLQSGRGDGGFGSTGQ